MQASMLIKGTHQCLLAAEPRCKGGDTGIIGMGKIWTGSLQLWQWQSTMISEAAGRNMFWDSTGTEFLSNG